MQGTPTQAPAADTDRTAARTASPTTSIVDGLLGEVVQGSLTKDSRLGQPAKPGVGRSLNAALAQVCNISYSAWIAPTPLSPVSAVAGSAWRRPGCVASEHGAGEGAAAVW